MQHIRFGLFPFRSPLIRESRLISFPRPTQMLHFGWFAVPCLRKGLSLRTRFSFGDRWINGCMLLPSAYRSVPRPSSLLKPSHPPSDVFAPVTLELTRLCMAIIVNTVVSTSSFTLHFHAELHLFHSWIVCSLRARPQTKEVIRPQVPLRPPCYDFSLLTELAFDDTN